MSFVVSVIVVKYVVARILITSGPTRQYLDPVRYLTNASSGRMGKALAEAALALGHEVVDRERPRRSRIPGRRTRCPGRLDRRHARRRVARVRPLRRPDRRRRPLRLPPGPRRDRTRSPRPASRVDLHLIETDDVVATLGARKGSRWVVGFALETEDHRLRALAKLERKHCDLVVSNGAEAISSLDNTVEIIAPDGEVLAALAGTKESVAAGILKLIDERLIASSSNC